MRAVSGRLYLAAALVYLVQGTGLLVVGANHYIGHGWWDQFHYTALAEFFAAFPFSTTLESLGPHAHLVSAVFLKDDRIGQSVLQAFASVSSSVSAKAMFAPTILLCPALTVMAVYALGRRLSLSAGWALTCSVVAGLLPAITALQLDCFLSQCLALPLLLILPIVLDDLNAAPSWATVARVAILLAATAAVYTEFTPILLGLLLLTLVVMSLGWSPRWQLLGWYCTVVATALALNIAFDRRLAVIAQRVTAAGASAETYPWALSMEAWARVWLGELASVQATRWAGVLTALALVVTALAYVGLIYACWQSIGQAAPMDEGAHRRLAVLSAVLALALLPLGVRLKDSAHPYQFYKLLLSVAPLLVLGLGLLALSRAAASNAERWCGLRRLRTWIAGTSLLLVLMAAIAGTLKMVLDTTTQAAHARSYAHLMHSSDMRFLQDHLESSPGGNVAIVQHNGYVTSWLSYLARHQRLWLLDIGYAGPILAETLRPQGIVGGTRLPHDVCVITRHEGAFSRVDPGDMRLVWAGRWFQLWQAQSARWALPVEIVNANGLETRDGHPFFWMGGPPTQIEVLAGSAGQLTLSGRFIPGPSSLSSSPIRFRVNRAGGPQIEREINGGEMAVSLPVNAGKSLIFLEALAEPRLPDGSQPPLVVGIQGLSVSFGSEQAADVVERVD
jgi:hypothetical protein